MLPDSPFLASGNSPVPFSQSHPVLPEVHSCVNLARLPVVSGRRIHLTPATPSGPEAEVSCFLSTEVLPRLGGIQWPEQLIKIKIPGPPPRNPGSEGCLGICILTSTWNHVDAALPCPRLLGSHRLQGWYLCVSCPQVMPPYGCFVFQMNEIK